ncbi:MAG TPA: MarR family transcriptional regulator [Steroidobacteraceae bacterium]|nr:MarR family transcriptional regulator [Steroidobacteraceae bacterium]
MIGFDLIDAGRLYSRYFNERYRQLNLTHCRALLALAQNQGITQSRLAELITLDSAALGRILDRLEVSRWAKRHPHPGDRRARSLVITEEARALLPFMWRVVAESQRDALQGLSVEEKQVLMSALERVLENLRLRTGALE